MKACDESILELVYRTYELLK